MSDNLNSAYEISVPEKPLRLEALVCEEIEGENTYVYIQEDNGTTITLNGTASAIFDMCDGQMTAEGMAQVISETLNVDYQDTLRDVKEVLAELEGFGFLQN